MDLVVIDTDVVSFLAKGDSRGSLYSASLANRQACVCFQTVAELRLWAIVRQLGASRSHSLDLLLKRLTVLVYNAEMADGWAKITAHRRRAGHPIDCGDAWIAASAIL